MRSTPQKRSAELPPFVFGAPQPAAKRSTPSGLDSSQRVSLPSASAAAAPAEYDDTYDFDEDVCDTRVYASFLYEGGAVGLALYAAASGVLATTSSVAPTESDAVWLMTMFKEQVATPEVIVASSTISDSLKSELFFLAAQPAVEGGEGGAAPGGGIHVQLQAPSAFALEPARRLLATLRIHDTTAGSWLAEPLPGSEGLTLQQQWDEEANGGYGGYSSSSGAAPPPAAAAASSRLGSFIDLDDALAVRAAGGLLSALLRVGVLSEFAGPGSGVHLPGGVRMFALENFVRMDAAAFQALSIFPKASASSLISSGKEAKAGGKKGGPGRGRGAAAASSSGAPAAAVASAAGALTAREAGFSVYGLLNRCVTAPGSKLLRAWCQRPALDAALIRHRHDALQFLLNVRRQHPEAWVALRRAQKSCVDLGPVMLRLKTGKAALRDWAALRKSLVSILTVRQAIEQLLEAGAAAAAPGSAGGYRGPKVDPAAASSEPPAFSATRPLLLYNLVADTGEQGLVGLYSALDTVIDWSRSGAIGVLPGVDPTLDAVRSAYAGLPDVLGSLADALLASFPTLRSVDVQYIPQVGVVVVVDKADNGIAPGTAGGGAAGAVDPATAARLMASAVPASSHGRRLNTGVRVADGASPAPVPAHLPYGALPQAIRPAADSISAASIIPYGFELQFETAGQLVYKNPDARALDEQYGDIAGTIADLEAGVLRRLEDQVLGYEAPLLLAGLRLAEADVLAALAEVSGDLGYKRPALVADPVIVARGVRHPLQELAVPDGAFIPNDVTLAPAPAGPGTLALITGPNCSGKSVYLKSVGLLVFLTQIGCFVPAERAAVGLVDGLYTRIESRESAAAGPGVQASSFALDVQQVGLALRHATPRSLLLIDEFGKGTAPVDGVAILASTLRALLRPALAGPGSSGPTAVPRALVTTHFHEVLDPELLLHGFQSSSNSGGAAAAASGPSLAGLLAQYQMAVVLEDEGEGGAGSSRGGATAAAAVAAVFGGSAVAKPVTTVTPLFKLVPGHAASSYGDACAARAGIGGDVLARAAAVRAALAAGLPVLPLMAGAGSGDDEGNGGDVSWRDSRRLQKEALRLELVASVVGSPQPWLPAAGSDTVAPPEAVLAVLSLLAQAV